MALVCCPVQSVLRIKTKRKKSSEWKLVFYQSPFGFSCTSFPLAQAAFEVTWPQRTTSNFAQSSPFPPRVRGIGIEHRASCPLGKPSTSRAPAPAQPQSIGVNRCLRARPCTKFFLTCHRISALACQQEAEDVGIYTSREVETRDVVR